MRLNRCNLDMKGIKIVFCRRIGTTWLEMHLPDKPLNIIDEAKPVSEDAQSFLVKSPRSTTDASSTAGDFVNFNS